jgi:hypothetical protein
VIPHHGPLSLYTKLGGPSIAIDFYLPWYGLGKIFKSLRIFKVTALLSMCKATLKQLDKKERE